MVVVGTAAIDGTAVETASSPEILLKPTIPPATSSNKKSRSHFLRPIGPVVSPDGGGC